MQYELAPADLALVLALHRAGTLAAAGERLNVNASTVFRMLQRLERGLGQALFERGRRGYKAMELARTLAAQAEQVEAALEAARTAAQAQPGQAAGTVRITTTDTLLHGLLAPALAALHRAQPRLQFELHTGNELASLTRRDADIALRATSTPPAHLIGRRVGPIRVALYAAKSSAIKHWDQVEAGDAAWVAPDDGLPEHPSVRWRQKHFPTLQPAFRTGSVQSVAELVASGLGVGVLPLFLAEPRRELRRLTEPLDEAETDLWLLTHPETRHLQRVQTVWGHLAAALQLS
ncbi:DNA-binding transcriptional LysR family regulator [Pelomonas saccharophila]|uniref:DNA-binding transcriptional LysR family regulator n=1 Tax=Roseateles saccharophilus TaxID=304 RepID=A0ABU1YQ70_ROSSA|nr:LysR family transcriptional regulator [Roseateles saccharophilus]MDR7271004.1 DNA-binding transcriptional LysR family regulator [Roseateles saccharophilus]